MTDVGSPSEPEPTVRNVRIDLAYRGSQFYGFADSPGVPSVERSLVDALQKVLRHPVSLFVGGRTDKGVHATGQVVNFTTDAQHFHPLKLRGAVNKLCAPAVVVSAVEEVPAEFHARFSAVGRSYRYRLHVSVVSDPLRSDLVWWVPPAVSVDAMNNCARLLIGSHDFGGFCKRTKRQPEASMVRRVTSAEWQRHGDEIHFVIAANAFCHQMVRSMVGAMVQVGRDRIPASTFEHLLETGVRAHTAEPAPPQGLVLEEVIYE